MDAVKSYKPSRVHFPLELVAVEVMLANVLFVIVIVLHGSIVLT